MKKSVFAVCAMAVMVMAGSQAFAGGNTGCGLGTVIWKGKSGLISELSAVTTNASTYSQFFGITSGTSGCDSSNRMVYDGRVERFISNNMSNLANDIARGEGEYLNTLAILLEVEDANMGSFKKSLQDNFGKIYTSETVTAAEVAHNIDSVVNS